MNYKIKQIFVLSGNYVARFEGENGEVDPESNEPVECFALVEYEENEEVFTETSPMILSDGVLTVAMEFKNYADFVKM